VHRIKVECTRSKGPAVAGPLVLLTLENGYRASRRNSRAVRRPSRRASRPARRPSRRASRPARRASRRSCPAVWASASVTSAGVIATNPPNAAASPRRENAPRREIISVALLMCYSGFRNLSYKHSAHILEPDCFNRNVDIDQKLFGDARWWKDGRELQDRQAFGLTVNRSVFPEPASF
jgi:hypothetical protein